MSDINHTGICLMNWTGASVPSEVREWLLAEAYILFRTRSRHHRFSLEHAEGIVTTTFRSQTLDGFSGIAFSATISSEEGGDQNVEFLAREEALDAIVDDDVLLCTSGCAYHGSHTSIRPNPLRKIRRATAMN